MDKKALLEQLLKNAKQSKKRQAAPVVNEESDRKNPTSTDSAETNWKRRRNEILSSLSKIQGTAVAPKPSEEKKQPLNKEEVRMNLQLMRGEVPQVYKDLLLRFKVADIFLKQGGSKMTRLTDVNNYLSLSDIKMSFLEKHVQQIVFLYAFEEKTDEEKVAYVMGRTKPRISTDLSILTLKLPQNDHGSVKDQMVAFLGSSKNLSGVFSSLSEEGRKDYLKERYDKVNKHIADYIEHQYSDYLERVKSKPLSKGRVAGFTMKELGEIPLGEIPPPIKIYRESSNSILDMLKNDVHKAISEKKLPPTSPTKAKGFYKGIDIDFSLLWCVCGMMHFQFNVWGYTLLFQYVMLCLSSSIHTIT